jgi:hypothetical protein
VAALRRADHSSKESYRLCKNDYETEGEARLQKRAIPPLMNEYSLSDGNLHLALKETLHREINTIRRPNKVSSIHSFIRSTNEHTRGTLSFPKRTVLLGVSAMHRVYNLFFYSS